MEQLQSNIPPKIPPNWWLVTLLTYLNKLPSEDNETLNSTRMHMHALPNQCAAAGGEKQLQTLGFLSQQVQHLKYVFEFQPDAHHGIR